MLPTRVLISRLMDDARVWRALAALADQEGDPLDAQRCRDCADASEREAGELLVRPLVPGVQGVAS